MSNRHYDWLHHHAQSTPTRPCWTDLASDRTFTFAEADVRVRALASGLQGLGVEKGDRVAVLAHNSTDVLEIHSACAWLGAICVLMNWRLAAPELDFILTDAEAKVFIHDEDVASTVAAMAEKAPHTLLTTGLGQPSPYEDLIADAGGDIEPCNDLTHDDIWSLMYTSGTTGRPKGAPQTFGMALTHTINSSPVTGMHAGSVTLTATPLFHTAGLNCWSMPFLHNGAHNLVARTFDPTEVLRLIGDKDLAVSHFLLVPAMYLFLAQHPDFGNADFSHVACASVGGAPTPKPLLDTWASKGLVVQQGFGMTETSPLVSIQTAEVAMAKVGSAGRTALHGEFRIMREDGAVAADDEVGELQVRGPNITPFYWRRPETAKTDWVDGWFKTGDAARVDADGDLWIVDRWKDMYISGGENVYPAEVESVLHSLDGVADAAVVGAPDEKWGEIGVAFIVRAPNSAIEEGEVITGCNGRLARYKIPKRVEFIDELPRNATGKILKRELRERFG